jgi:dihydropteroate synthase
VPPDWLSDDAATLMAVVNLNADSFSDPRPDATPDDLPARLGAARADGADVVDIGAQSAALDALVVPTDEQIAALVPAVRAAHTVGLPVSVDTYDPDVTAAVLAAGAEILNDFSGQQDERIVTACADAGAWYVLTHNPVGPRRRQTDPDFYGDVCDDVIAFFDHELILLTHAGLRPDRILLDPGVDVGKTPAQTLELLRGRDRIRAAFDLPQLWAISRKDVLGALTGRRPRDRDAATLALVAALADQPRTLLRVHDVAAARDVLTVAGALAGRIDLDAGALLDDRLRREG